MEIDNRFYGRVREVTSDEEILKKIFPIKH
jgi:hypothetical protein